MPKSCQLCGNETDLYLHGFPLCIDCDQALDAKAATPKEKLEILKNTATDSESLPNT